MSALEGHQQTNTNHTSAAKVQAIEFVSVSFGILDHARPKPIGGPQSPELQTPSFKRTLRFFIRRKYFSLYPSSMITKGRDFKINTTRDRNFTNLSFDNNEQRDFFGLVSAFQTQ